MALVHHDEAVTQTDGVVHVVCDHERGERVLLNQALREREHLCGGLWVERGGVLVQEQQLRALEHCHQKRERLALAAGEQADLRGHAVLQAKVQHLQALVVVLALLARDAPREAAVAAAARREGEVLVYLHVSRGAAHGVLEHAAQVGGALVLWQARDVAAVELDFAAVGREDACDAVQQR